MSCLEGVRDTERSVLESGMVLHSMAWLWMGSVGWLGCIAMALGEFLYRMLHLHTYIC